MYIKKIKYTDFNGIDREEEFYFNLTDAELMELQYGHLGGLDVMLKKIIQTQNTPELIEIFKTIIMKSYGERSDDGREFKKVDDDGKPLNIRFAQTQAYSELYMELATNDKAAANFVNGIVSKKVSEEMAKANANINKIDNV